MNAGPAPGPSARGSSRVVGVVGPGDAPDELCERARQVGSLLARRGAVVVTGGLGGVMAAAARGAHEGGGFAVGLLPGADRAEADDAVGLAIPTGLGQARNALVVSTAEAVIAVGGSWGTLSEVALAQRAGKPVVCLRGWLVTDADGRAVPLPTADSAAEAVDLVAAALGWPDESG